MRPLKKLKHYLEITKASIGIIPACLGRGIFFDRYCGYPASLP